MNIEQFLTQNRFHVELRAYRRLTDKQRKGADFGIQRHLENFAKLEYDRARCDHHAITEIIRDAKNDEFHAIHNAIEADQMRGVPLEIGAFSGLLNKKPMPLGKGRRGQK